MNEMTAPKRNIAEVTVEIKVLQNQAQTLIIGYAIEIGKKLTEAKSILPYGKWGEWLKNEVEFSQDTANRLMKVYEEFGSNQVNMFGNSADSAALRNLTYTKALKLIAIPNDEREYFIKDNDVENISTRELDKLIKERDEALKAKETAEKEKQEVSSSAQTEKTKLQKELTAAQTESKQAEKRIEELEKRPIEMAVMKPDEEAIKKAVDEAIKADKAKNEQEILKLKAKLQETEDKQSKIKAELDKTIAEKKKMSEAEKKKQTESETVINAEKQQMESQIERLKKQIEIADAGVTEFKTLYNEAQLLLNRMIEKLNEIKNQETKGKLQTAVIKMFEVYKERI